MSSIIPVLSSPISLLIKLGKEAKKYQTKKKTKDRVLSALGDDKRNREGRFQTASCFLLVV